MSTPGHQRRDRAAEPGDLAQVGHQRLAGAGVLHLDRDVAAVVPAALVHLADRRRGGRSAVQPDQLVLPVRAEALRDLVADGLGRHRRRGVLQPGQLLAVGAGHLLGQRRLEHAQRLTELHRPALELAEGPEQLLGGALLDVGQHRLRRTLRPAACRARARCARRTPAAGPPVAPCAPRPCGEDPGPAWRHSPRPVHGVGAAVRHRTTCPPSVQTGAMALWTGGATLAHTARTHISDRCGGTTGELGAIGPGPQSCAWRVRPREGGDT